MPFAAGIRGLRGGRRIPARAPARLAGRALARDRRGHVATWLACFLLLGAGVWFVTRLEEDSKEHGFNRIDPRYSRVEPLSGYFDDRWRLALASRLAVLPEISADDAEGIEAVRRSLVTLPFVAEVGPGTVMWPDGLELPVRFRRPIACLPARNGYVLVAEDGVVLPGDWTRPPRVDGAWLPVLGPIEGAPRGPDAGIGQGDRIRERRHRDALSIAASMRSALSTEDFEAMGAALIDASRAPMASVAEPGAVIDLEGGRRVYFGRTPDCGEPGELPAVRKWAALARALRMLRPSAIDPRDWSLLDVRWDVPDILWRDAPTSPDSVRGDATPGALAPAAVAGPDRGG